MTKQRDSRKTFRFTAHECAQLQLPRHLGAEQCLRIGH